MSLWRQSTVDRGLTELGAFMRTEFLCISVLRVASGPRVKLASCKSALNPPVVYSTDRSKAVVPVLVLLFVALRFTRRFVVCLTMCHFVLVIFSPFSIAITSLGEERANLSAFRTFVRFVLVWTCNFLFLLVSGKGCGLWLLHYLDFSLTFFFLSVKPLLVHWQNAASYQGLHCLLKELNETIISPRSGPFLQTIDPSGLSVLWWV